MSRIREKFGELKRSGRGGFIPFITAGDPDLATTERMLIELAKAGADIIELGVPFSDPVADGEVIQRASERALRNGVTLHDVLTCAKNVRQDIDVPIVLFSYFNPLLQFGPEPFAPAARQAGIDAVLVTDLIPEEAESWTQNLLRHRLDPIFFVAPTTSDKRLARIAQQAHGFIYAVSRAGVTGARDQMTRDAEALVKRVRASQRFAGRGWIWHLKSRASPRRVAFCRRSCCRQRHREANREVRGFTRSGEAHRRICAIACPADVIISF